MRPQRFDGLFMKIIRITDSHKSIAERWIYHLLEYFDTFSLVECKDRSSVCIRDTTDTLVLDHYDESQNPAAILHQVINFSDEIKVLILVDKEPRFHVDNSSFIECDMHMALGKDSLPSAPDVTCVNDLDVAVQLLEKRLTRAA